MTWTKISDDFFDRAAKLGLSPKATVLHLSATTYANRLGLDGAISRKTLRILPAPSTRITVVRELVAAGWWLETDDGWQLVGPVR